LLEARRGADPEPVLPGGPAPEVRSRAEEADRYWEGMDLERAAARSAARAEIGLRLLSRAGLRGGRLLEVGCGPGFALERFRAAGFQASGVDASPAAVSRARARGLPVERLDLELEPLPGPFEVVAALEVLEHLRDPLRALAALARALAPAGRLLVSLPNEFHLARRLSILAGNPGAAGHRPFGGHDDPHLRFFTPRQAERLFGAAALRVVARGWDGLLPPRWKGLRPLSAALAALRPPLFALSGLYLLEPGRRP
jgi:SAM-dependent methyltransferase